MSDNSVSFEDATKPASISFSDATQGQSVPFDDAVKGQSVPFDAAVGGKSAVEQYSELPMWKKALAIPGAAAETAINLVGTIPAFVAGTGAAIYKAGEGIYDKKTADEIRKQATETGARVSKAWTPNFAEPVTTGGQAATEVLGQGFNKGIQAAGQTGSLIYGGITGDIKVDAEKLATAQKAGDWKTVHDLWAAAGEKYSTTEAGKLSQLVSELGVQGAMAVGAVKGFVPGKGVPGEVAPTDLTSLKSRLDALDQQQTAVPPTQAFPAGPGAQGELPLQGPSTPVEAVAARRALNSPQQDMFLNQEPYAQPAPKATAGPEVQGPGTLYGDTQGNISPELASRLREDPQAVEAYRIAQQHQLAEQQRTAQAGEPLVQGEQGTFEVQKTKVGQQLVEKRLEGLPPEQLSLDMGTGKPTEVNARHAENVTPEHLPDVPLRDELPSKTGALRSDTSSNFDIVGRPKIDFKGFLNDIGGLAGIKFNPLDNSFSASSIFDKIRAAGDKVHPDLIEVANKLETILNQLPESERPKYTLARKEGDFHDYIKMADGSLANAIYKPRGHEIVFGKTGFNARTFLHETVHSLTARSLNLYERAVGNKTAKGDPVLLKKLNDMGINLQALRNMYKLYDVVSHHAKMQKESAYGVKDVHEFAAESMASPYFQEFISGIHAPGFAKLASGAMNAFDAFKGIIGNLFEKRVFAADNAFGRTIDMVSDVMKDYTANAKAINEVFNETFSPEHQQVEFVNAMKSDTRQMAEDAPKPIKNEEERRIDTMSDIPGLDKISRDYIPKPPAPEEVKAALSAGPDMKPGAIFKNTIGSKFVIGNSMQALLQNNHGINLFGKLFENGRKMGDYWGRVRVNPLEETIRELGQGPSSELREVMIREMNNRKQYTPDQLKSLGLSKDQMDAYTHVRKEQVFALQRMNEARAELGLDKVTPEDAYLTSKWQGDWRTPVFQLVRDAGGNITGKKMVGWVAEDNKPAAMKAIDHLQKTLGDITAEEPTFRKGFGFQGKDMIGAYSDLAKLLGKDDPAVLAVEKTLQKYYEGQGFEFRGQPKHFEAKGNVGGFLGNRPWANPVKDNNAFWQAQMQQMRQAHEWSEMQGAVDKAGTLLKDADLLKSHPNTLNYLRDYASIQMGFGESKLIRAIEQELIRDFAIVQSKIPILDRVPSSARNVSAAIGIQKNVFYLLHLGVFKPQTFIVNGLIQNIFNAPKHIELSSQGYQHSALANVAKTAVDALDILKNHYGMKTDLNPFAQEMMNYLDSNGIVVNQFAESHDLRKPESVHAIEKIAGLSMTESERIVRTNAFVSFSHHLNDSGKFADSMEIFKKAEDLVNDTHANFRSGERAMVFNQLGLAGKSLNTLKTFSLNQLNQLAYYSKYALRTGNYGPIVALAGIQFALAGALGFWGVQTVGKVWDLLSENMPTRWVGADAIKWMTENNPRKRLQEMSDKVAWIKHGTLAALTGINFSSSLDSSAVISPEWKDMLPVVADSSRMFDKVKDLIANPNRETRDQALYQISPDSVKGYLDTHLPSFTAPSGVSTSPTNPGVGNYTRGKGMGLMSNTDEKTIRTMGLMSTKEAMTKERNYQAKVTEGQMSDRQKEEEQRLMSSFRITAGGGNNEDAIIEHLQNFIKYGGDPRTLNTATNEAIEKWNYDKKTQYLRGAKGYEGLQKYLLIQKLLNAGNAQ